MPTVASTFSFSVEKQFFNALDVCKIRGTCTIVFETNSFARTTRRKFYRIIEEMGKKPENMEKYCFAKEVTLKLQGRRIVMVAPIKSIIEASEASEASEATVVTTMETP